MDAYLGPQTSGVPPSEHVIDWYRTPLPKELNARLHERSDLRGAAQTLGFLSALLGSGGAALHFSATPHHAATALFVLLYGLIANFLINGMHELGHKTVFKTQLLNALFLRVFSFLGWLHPDMFFSSHLRHHRFTQNAPHDLENPMPIVLSLRGFLQFGFINLWGFGEALGQTARAALGVHPTGHLGWLPEWEETCYPAALPQARAPAQRWAAFMLAGHAAIAAASLARGCWLLPFLLSCGPFYNGWLFWLCNSTQHVGMQPGKADFRLNTRTFYLHPVLGFFYWHMNYHSALCVWRLGSPGALGSAGWHALTSSPHATPPSQIPYPHQIARARAAEHHMYANVPCYYLAELHQAIKHDLPHTPSGLVEVWQVIGEVMKKQALDKGATCDIVLPAKKDS